MGTWKYSKLFPHEKIPLTLVKHCCIHFAIKNRNMSTSSAFLLFSRKIEIENRCQRREAVIYSWLACHEYDSKAKREQKRASVSDELASSFSSKYARLRNAAQSLIPRERTRVARRAYIRNLAAIITTYHGKNAREVVAGGETRCHALGAIHLSVAVRLEITMWIWQFYSYIRWYVDVWHVYARITRTSRPRVATLGPSSKLRAKMTTGREKVPTYIIVNCVCWYRPRKVAILYFAETSSFFSEYSPGGRHLLPK